MRRWPFVALAAVLVLGASGTAGAAPRPADRLDAYTVRVDAEQLRYLGEQGYEVTPRSVGRRIEASLVLTRAQRAELERRGIAARLTRLRDGRTVRQFAAAQAQGGFTVWRSWDEPGGIRDEQLDLARANRDLVKVVRLGTTGQGREILALKVTRDARRTPDGARPAVLFSSTQHAREWVGTEVNRRLLRSYVDGWNNGDAAVRRVLRRNELWFVLVANPDGYQYTFDAERLWRKNLRDNNGDGQVQVGDGVDPNRNFPNHWKYDEEGSSSIPSSDTYRGPAPASEPETQALTGLLDRVSFSFHVNWHSFGQYLLYTEGWQIATPTADDPIFFALSGNLDRPAIADFHPGIGSDVLYVTNGETTDYAHANADALAWTPELSEGCEGCGFVFPDDEALVQAEFERNLPFARSVVESAEDPAEPKSSLGIETKPFYIRSDDPYKDGLPEANFTFAYSYGDPQPVDVVARRSLGAVTVRYRINGGPVQTAPTEEWRGGERYDPADVYYRRMRGTVTGTSPGDSVEVWFTGGGERSESFTYQAVSETENGVLVVAAEDYTGASPEQPPGPHYLDDHLDALAANGIAADVYDVDARGRIAPDALGVLSHYDAVVWYTGDDIVTRELGRGPGHADRLAMDQLLEFRAYLNEGGKVLYTGQAAGAQQSINLGLQFYDPKDEGPCPNEAFDPRRCLGLFGSPSSDLTNDVLQYWFGGYLGVLNDGIDEATGEHFDAVGVDIPFGDLRWSFGGPDSADNQALSSSFLATSGVLPPDQFPQFRSWPSSRWDKPGGPFAPHTGEQFVYSQIADVAYKRLTREIAVPASGAQPLTFWTSYSTEPEWDHVIVEARTAGGDDWTTLPDANGHTAPDPGQSCPADWRSLHPQLDHYQTLNEDGTCTATGTTGEWHSASGNSGGWQEWSIDLSRWAGQAVEVSISYVTDFAVQNLGVIVDDITLPDGTSTSFEEDLGGWAVSGPPAGSAQNGNDWIRTSAAGFPVGASITTPDTLLLGFGIEGIAGADARRDVIGRAMQYLLAPAE